LWDKLPAGASGEVQYKGAPEERPGFRDTVIGIRDAATVGWTRPAVIGTFRSLPLGLDDLFIITAQVALFPLNEDEAVNTSVTIGLRASRPIRLPTPVVISGMSFGAVSKNVCMSIAQGGMRTASTSIPGKAGCPRRSRISLRTR
jgi:glutamate synthase domain-containing protein 2